MKPLDLPVGEAWISALAFSPNGEILATGDDQGIFVFWDPDIGRGGAAEQVKGDPVTALAFPSGVKFLAIGFWSGKILVDSGGEALNHDHFEPHEENITALVFSPDGKILASASGDDTLRLTETATGDELWSASHEDDYDVNTLAFSPDGKRLASADADGLLRIWDVETGELFDEFRPHKNAISAVLFTADGKGLLSASWDKTVRLSDAGTGELKLTFEGHEDAVNSLALLPDGKRLVTGSWDKTVRLWDLETGKQLAILTRHEDKVTALAAHPNGKHIASASKGSVKISEVP